MIPCPLHTNLCEALVYRRIIICIPRRSKQMMSRLSFSASGLDVEPLVLAANFEKRARQAKLCCHCLQVAAAGLTLPAVMLARGMVGLGEGVALPAMNNLVANNIPMARRSTALGGCFTGFHTGQKMPCCTTYICTACMASQQMRHDETVGGNNMSSLCTPYLLAAFSL